jgi:hypothetical protein
MRVRLLKELHDFTTPQGRLILFDDLELTKNRHRMHAEGTVFHLLQFGGSILGELKAVGWKAAVVNSVEMKDIQAELEMPFILAAKRKELLLDFVQSAQESLRPEGSSVD